MKNKLVLAAALIAVAPLANAHVVGQIPNDQGGYINLTDQKGDCPQYTLMAFTTTSTGQSMNGCWMPDNGTVMVAYRGQGIYRYTNTLDTRDTEKFINRYNKLGWSGVSK